MRVLVTRHAPHLRACTLLMLDDESLADEIDCREVRRWRDQPWHRFGPPA